MKKTSRHVIGLAAALVLVTWALYQNRGDAPLQEAHAAPPHSNQVTLPAEQIKNIKLSPVQLYDFTPQRTAFGYIDFNQDETVQIYSRWSGRVKEVFARTGDHVQRGQLLFSIDSPDLVQAEANLIASAGLLRLATATMERVKRMLAIKVASRRDLEQAIASQQSAKANHKAARDAVRIFGKSEQEMARIIATRRADGELRITAPMGGEITARNLSVGMLVQPGTSPAPLTLANLSILCLVATVPELDLPLVNTGEAVMVSVAAYPGRHFEGTITSVGASVDPATHTITVHSEIRDPDHLLRPQMPANFTIRTGSAISAAAIPVSGVVRESDGTLIAFVSEDGRRFERRTLTIGMEQEGFDQIVSGITTGEKVATEGALFISNALALQQL